LRSPSLRGRRRSAPPGSIDTAIGGRLIAATRRRPSARGSSRSVIGSSVVELGMPGRRLTSVASTRRASGRRRTTTVWSAPVADPSSSTIAATMASGETDRDNPCRMRAKLSASERRPVSRARIARRWRTAARPVTSTRPPSTKSIVRGWPAARRSAVSSPRTKKDAARNRQVRRMVTSCGSVARARAGADGRSTCEAGRRGDGCCRVVRTPRGA